MDEATTPDLTRLVGYERRLTDVRLYVQARVQDLEEQYQRHRADGYACMQRNELEAATRHLRQAAMAGSTVLELRHVLDRL